MAFGRNNFGIITHYIIFYPTCFPRPNGSVAGVYTDLHCSIHWFVLVHTLQYESSIHRHVQCTLGGNQVVAVYFQCILQVPVPVYTGVHWQVIKSFL